MGYIDNKSLKMQVFKFSTKEQGRVYSILTTISVILGIIFLFQWSNIRIDSAFAFMIVSIISFISLMKSIKKASKTFAQIEIDGNEIVFYFSNKMKNKVIKDINEIILIDKTEFLEIKSKKEGEYIGKAFKNRMKDIDKWSTLIKLLKKNDELPTNEK